MTRLAPGAGVDAATLTTPFEVLDAAQVRAGSPATRHLQLDEAPGHTVGIWEHTPGVSTDIEADEVFVVLAGSATLEFEEPALPPVELAPLPTACEAPEVDIWHRISSIEGMYHR